MQIQLDKHSLPHGGWQQSGNLFLVGYGHFDEWELRASDLERVLKECESPEALKDVLASLNGCFAFVFKDEEKVVAAVDLCRSIPLFYSSSAVADNPFSGSIDRRLADLLPHMEFVEGSSTLRKGWRQIEPGNFIWSESGKPWQQYQYFSHLRTGKELPDRTDFHGLFAECLVAMTERLVAGLNGRTAVVPLSGGFDSRLILALLVKAGYEKIQAFTYGREDGHEAQIASKVCDTLSVDWQFIPYQDELYEKNLGSEWDAYLRYAGAFTSVPQEQEFFAVKKLTDALPEDAVFLPGFCGDVQAGSFIPDQFYEKRWSKNKIGPEEYVFEKLSRLPEQSNLLFKPEEEMVDFASFYDRIEEWVLMEREAKYIINGVRCYEYFGFSWMLPLWDRAFIEFWQKVPMHLRRDRALYVEVLNKELFKSLGIVHKPKHFDARFSSGSWQSWLRYVLPKGIKQQAKKLLIPGNESEINNLNVFRDLLAKKGKIELTETTPVNEVMGRYYCQLLKLEGEGE